MNSDVLCIGTKTDNTKEIKQVIPSSMLKDFTTKIKNKVQVNPMVTFKGVKQQDQPNSVENKISFEQFFGPAVFELLQPFDVTMSSTSKTVTFIYFCYH